MKRRFGFRFRSIYTKFTLLFLVIWWFMNMFTFTVTALFMRSSTFNDLSKVHPSQFEEFRALRSRMSVTFLFSLIVGSLIILMAVKSIVKPIKKLSEASKEVASGNFDIQMEVESQDELGRLTEDFNLMVTELNNLDQMRNEFVSNVSHEFKTPITSIKGYAKLLKKKELDPAVHDEYADIIVTESERLSLLSSNLLKLSTLDSRAIQTHRTRFSLDEEIRKVILILEPQWTKKEIDLDVDLEDLVIEGDRQLLYEVWMNLIQNAVKFSKEKGTVSVKLEKTGDKIVFRTVNSAADLKDEETGRFFERFYKGDPSRSSEGSGLGLAIAKKIIDAHGGNIKVDSREGEITFTVELEEEHHLKNQ